MKLLLIGGSGLVGSLLLDRLATLPGVDTHALLRRPVADRNGISQTVCPTDQWAAAATGFGPDMVISTLGTTIAQAGSKPAFAAIDHDLVLGVARAARAAGASRCIAVSSVGAATASGNFYLATKGRVEDALATLDFDRLDILRPGLLLGERNGPARPAERLGMMLAPLTNLLTPRSLDRYRAIDARTVAAAIAALLAAAPKGRFIHHNREMHALAD